MQARNPDYGGLKAEDLSIDVPTTEQAAILRKLCSKGYEVRWAKGSPLFDREGRRKFQELIKLLLLKVRDSLDDLKEFLADDKSVKRGVCGSLSDC